jgi:hypothetical protein
MSNQKKNREGEIFDDEEFFFVRRARAPGSWAAAENSAHFQVLIRKLRKAMTKRQKNTHRERERERQVREEEENGREMNCLSVIFLFSSPPFFLLDARSRPKEGRPF